LYTYRYILNKLPLIPLVKASGAIGNSRETAPIWADKAGGYDIGGVGGYMFVKKIDGDFYNARGLPIGRLYHVLRDMGII
jgi:hypothetical protein